ncbi:MAG: [Fe-Fe] hydrogenase large subunit C-terminal domain-containing protein [Patescibacteria group bacterium]|nr:[Fe-Fe] hydrogenase large subunit C-terminal domain-containing protein [Patescibacteria group bacterium]
MSKRFDLIIDGKKVGAEEGETILKVAWLNGIDIPHLCFHPDNTVRANCRMCLVAIKGERALQTACSTLAEDGMEVTTVNPAIKRDRKFNLELIFGEHVEDCPVCVWNSRCDLLKYRKQYNSKMLRFPDRKTKRPIYEFGPIVFDQTKCIDCRNCVDICPTEYLEVEGVGSDIGIAPSMDRKKDCIYCGQCVVHCPAGAIKSQGEYGSQAALENLLKQKDKTVVVQFAPVIRSSIGEEMGLPYGTIATGQLVAGLRKFGFHKVFDTSVAADFTTTEEAGEAVKHIMSGKNLPVFTSCCPSWVRFIEYNYPEYIKNITSVRAPEIILGGLAKTYWAEKEGLDPKNIFMVSVMPCTSKKFEAQRVEMKINGLYPVDMVITTRELARIFLNKKIKIANLEAEAADMPFGDPSGAGVLYGASGGVMESALRTAYFRLTGEDLKDMDLFKEVRGQAGIKRATIKLCQPVKTGRGECVEIKAAAVNGIKNARIILDELKQDPKKYDFVEVMACPSGCAGGGGQSLPVNEQIRKKRIDALYAIDRGKKIRLAHRNPEVIEVYEKYFNTEEKRKNIFHTGFGQKPKTKIISRKRTKADGALHE